LKILHNHGGLLEINRRVRDIVGTNIKEKKEQKKRQRYFSQKTAAAIEYKERPQETPEEQYQ
jgi:hypothetical protein